MESKASVGLLFRLGWWNLARFLHSDILIDWHVWSENRLHGFAFSDRMKHDIIVYDACSYITLQDELKAYYYSALLNYLAFKVIQKEGAFERNQYLRPLIAVLHAGLEWKNQKWQLKVARLGKRLHQQTPKCLKKFIKDGMRIAECFERIKTCNKTKNLFANLIQTIDKNANMSRVYSSLRFVCKLKNPSSKQT